MAVVFKKDFVLFPFLYMPKLGVIEALMYLPTAFLADLGIVTVVLYFITQSGKDIKLPWPKFAVDLDEVKPPTEELLAEPRRHGRRGGHHAGHHRFRALCLRPAPDHLLRQRRLAQPASAVHAGRQNAGRAQLQMPPRKGVTNDQTVWQSPSSSLSRIKARASSLGRNSSPPVCGPMR